MQYQIKETVDFLLENATSLNERSEIKSLTEAQQTKISDKLISELFEMISTKSYVDYADIPKSAGDITKCDGYQNMVKVLDSLYELVPSKQKDARQDIEAVQKAIKKIENHKDTFVYGFKQKKEYVILQYNTLVMACYTATSLLITTTVDYLRNPQGDYEVHVVTRKENPGFIALTSLKTFNKIDDEGKFKKSMEFVIDNEKDAFVGTVAIGVVGIIAAIVALTVMARELVYLYYDRRTKLEAMLRQQAEFLIMNELRVKANTRLSADEQQKVIMKQNETAQKLIALADTIAVDNKMAEKQTKTAIDKENKTLTLYNMQGGISLA